MAVPQSVAGETENDIDFFEAFFQFSNCDRYETVRAGVKKEPAALFVARWLLTGRHMAIGTQLLPVAGSDWGRQIIFTSSFHNGDESSCDLSFGTRVLPRLES